MFGKKNKNIRDRILIKTKMPCLDQLIDNGVYYSFKKNTDLERRNDSKYIRRHFGKWKKHVKDYKVVVLGENWYSFEISKYIKEKNPNCTVIVYYWNKLVFPSYFEILKDPNVDKFYTFDEEEAEKYNFNFNTTYYSKLVKLNDLEIENDVVFLGRAKDRLEEIKKIEDKFHKLKITTDFKIITDEKDFVDYNDYLDMIAKSKVLFDYNAYNQTGLSLRAMESLFFEKKLITTNKNIKNYDFYNKNNIFIIGEDKYKDLPSFINSDYEKINQEIIDYYDFDEWIKRFK